MYALNVTIWVKFHDFTKISKQLTLENLINQDEDIYENAIKLFNKIWTTDSEKKVRALCVGVANLTDNYKVQLSIFNEQKIQIKKESTKLKNALDKIKYKYGEKAITYADKIEKNN